MGGHGKRARRLFALIAIFLTIATVASAAPLYDLTVDTRIRSTVLLVGDSNITRGGAQIVTTFTTRTVGAQLPVFASRSGIGIRGYGPTQCSGCAASDYWALRLPNILASVTPDVVVVNLGVNDSLVVGTTTTVGYGDYAAKIDWLMSQLPDVPVLWTNLPCTIFPAPYKGVGCDMINTLLSAARTRHPNLTVLAWRAAAIGHPEYMAADAPHYSPAGYTAWAKLVTTTLDLRFP